MRTGTQRGSCRHVHWLHLFWEDSVGCNLLWEHSLGLAVWNSCQSRLRRNERQRLERDVVWVCLQCNTAWIWLLTMYSARNTISGISDYGVLITQVGTSAASLLSYN